MRRFGEDLKNRVVAIGKLSLIKDMPSGVFTGLVIAGFGSDELFPTLISFEIDGIVSSRLKYFERNFIDIDRSGTRSLVVPFAQKEMVERFLYGLDEKIQRDVAGFCKEAITDITKRVLDQINFEDPSAKQSLKDDAKKGEDAFVRGLQDRAFSAIRTQSQGEIEDMVEFMPKPELARMAEALVNLTSIKRRVSRGVETVGGPIDVAVISHAEGFVWVKRKHYFSADLNPRYFERVKGERDSWRESDVNTESAGNSGASRRNDRMPRNKQKRDVAAPSGSGKSNA